MVVIKVDSRGYAILSSGSYTHCLVVVNNLIDVEERQGHFLIDTEHITTKLSIYTFASKTQGKLFELIICDGYVQAVKLEPAFNSLTNQ